MRIRPIAKAIPCGTRISPVRKYLITKVPPKMIIIEMDSWIK